MPSLTEYNIYLPEGESAYLHSGSSESEGPFPNIFERHNITYSIDGVSGPVEVIFNASDNLYYAVYKEDDVKNFGYIGETNFTIHFHDSISGESSINGAYSYDSYVDYHVTAIDNEPVDVGWTLKDIDGSNSPKFISIDGANQHFATRLGAYFVFHGAADETLTNLQLVMSQGDVKVYSELSKAARSALIGPEFGADNVLTFSDNYVFEFFNEDINSSGIDYSKNGTVDFTIIVETGSGRSASIDAGSAEILTQYELPRYKGSRDEKEGGDDWVQPDILPALKWFSKNYPVKFGDASNMNGGLFKPHKGHQEGLSVDAWFNGYNKSAGFKKNKKGKFKNDDKGNKIEKYEVTKKGVKKIAKAVKKNPHKDSIDDIYITYNNSVTKKYVNKIEKQFGLDDKLFGNESGHTTHFHIEFFDV